MKKHWYFLSKKQTFMDQYILIVIDKNYEGGWQKCWHILVYFNKVSVLPRTMNINTIDNFAPLVLASWWSNYCSCIVCLHLQVTARHPNFDKLWLQLDEGSQHWSNLPFLGTSTAWCREPVVCTQSRPFPSALISVTNWYQCAKCGPWLELPRRKRTKQHVCSERQYLCTD